MNKHNTGSNLNARQTGEAWDAYQERRRERQRRVKAQRQGKLLWDSESLGTYVREKHGPLV